MPIKELRTKYNLTQKSLSDITGIPKRTIEDWEAERRTPPEYIIRLVDSFLKNELK